MADQPKPLSQDDIDALIGEIAGTSPAVAKADIPAVSNAAAAIIGQAKDPEHVPAIIGKATHSLGNDDMDAMVKAPLESAPAEPAATLGSAAPATRSVEKPGTRRLQAPPPQTHPAERSVNPTERMDALLTSMETKAHQKAKDALTGSHSKSKDAMASGPLGQDDIDRLLSELGAGQPAKPATARTLAADAQRPGTKQLTKQITKPLTKQIHALPATTTVTAAHPPGSKAPDPAAARIGSGSDTLKLKPEEIDALVSKQAGIESDHSEAPMIDQGDIDALVKQLATATGAPDTKHISDALAQHGGEIDKLLEKAGEIRSTSDAMDMAHAPTLMAPTNKVMQGGHAPTTILATTEIRGAHWLLAAVLVFLAICSVSLMVIVTSINGLTRELRTSHPSALAPSDSFGDDLKAALAKLASPDDGEMTKGVLFLQRLKNLHPSHLTEISLTLIRHFREHGAYRQAVAEFAQLSDNTNNLFENPRLYLDYADSLTKTDDKPGALRQVYILLANESAYLSSRDAHNLPRSTEEIARNHQVIQDGYLALGQLLDQSPTGQKATAPVVADDQAQFTPPPAVVAAEPPPAPSADAAPPTDHATPAKAQLKPAEANLNVGVPAAAQVHP